MKSLRAAFLMMLTAAICAASVDAADSYPSKPVRLIVPYAPGGSSDIVARAVGQRLGEALQQTFVVDTRPGAATMIGTEIVAKAAPDGYTLIMSDPALTINAVATARPRYDALRDFTPISLIATTPHALMSRPAFSTSMKELLAMPKAQTEKLAMGTTGQGPYMTYEWLRSKTGLALNEVPYKGGGPALIDAIGGQIAFVFTPVAGGAAHLKSGRLKAIAITTAARHPLVPDTPTFVESGVPDFVVTHWFGVIAPAATPPEIVSTLDRELAKALDSPDVRARFATLALDSARSGADDFRNLIAAELRRWKDVVAQTNVRMEQ